MSDGKPKNFVTHPNDYNVSTYPETTLYKLFRKKNMDGYFDKAKYFLVFGNRYVMLAIRYSRLWNKRSPLNKGSLWKI